MKYYFIMNPGSQSGKSKKKFLLIFDFLKQHDIDFEFDYTTDLNSAYLMSQKANKKKFDIIVAVGGDGTINSVLNGFYDNIGNRISESAMGVIYTGTSPDFCKSYNIPWKNINHALNTLLENNVKTIQIGKINLYKDYDPALNNKFLDSSSKFITKYFACCANIGLGAALARNANNGIRKYTGDSAGTFLSLLRTLLTYRANNFQIKFDNKLQTITKLFNVSIGKTKYIASGIKVNNALSENDTRFYILIVKNMRFNNITEVFMKIYSGKNFSNNEIVQLDYSKTIEVVGNNSNPEIEFDGDPQGFLPCKIAIAKDKLNLITNA